MSPADGAERPADGRRRPAVTRAAWPPWEVSSRSPLRGMGGLRGQAMPHSWAAAVQPECGGCEGPVNPGRISASVSRSAAGCRTVAVRPGRTAAAPKRRAICLAVPSTVPVAAGRPGVRAVGHVVFSGCSSLRTERASPGCEPWWPGEARTRPPCRSFPAAEPLVGSESDTRMPPERSLDGERAVAPALLPAARAWPRRGRTALGGRANLHRTARLHRHEGLAEEGGARCSGWKQRR